MLEKKNVFFNNKNFILITVILMYLPVSLDATILHVATPSVALDLKASSKEVLWIIDIYSLVMACLLLPMGVFADKIGFKKISLIGMLLFCIASCLAYISSNTIMLICARTLLGIGAAMIIPATLLALRLSFVKPKERAVALGVWSAIGSGGAAFGPFVGGLLIENYSWNSVFFINIPICFIVFFMLIGLKEYKVLGSSKIINLLDPLLLMFSILMIVLGVKNLGASEEFITYLSFIMLGLVMLTIFWKRQVMLVHPMIDIELFKHKPILAGLILAFIAMATLVGFEFFVSQELQLVFGLSPFQAGLFLFPFIIASSISGPFVGFTLTWLGVKKIGFYGVLLSSLCFFFMAFMDFSSNRWEVWVAMIILGFCIEAALISSTYVIMNAAKKEKAGEVGAIEGMAYELGAGTGIILFGMIMTASFTANLSLDFLADIKQAPPLSLSEAIGIADSLPHWQGQELVHASKIAFLNSHGNVMLVAAILLILLSFIVSHLLKEYSEPNE
ncbi:MFS transporter [Enterobacter ludwigii]